MIRRALAQATDPDVIDSYLDRRGIKARSPVLQGHGCCAYFDDDRRLVGHFPAVVAPCNPRGYKMFPDREACEGLFRREPGRFFADEVTAGGSVAVETALAHVQALGLAGAVLDVRAVETAYREGELGAGTATRAV